MSRSWPILAGVMALAAISCSPSYYHRQADQRAYDIITRANKQALGRSDPFTIEPPAETLRRRLLLDQDLPISNAASLGASALTPIKNWPEKDYPARQDDLAASGVWHPAAAPAAVPPPQTPAEPPAATTPWGQSQPAAAQADSAPSTAAQAGRAPLAAAQAGGAAATAPAASSMAVSRKAAPPSAASQMAASQPAASEPVALELTLSDALQVAARNNRDFQTQKENVFEAALALDLESNEFRSILASSSSATYTDDRTGADPVRGISSSTDASASRTLKQGTALTAAIGLDLVSLLTKDHSGSMGLTGDATITVPLLRGAGWAIVTEPLTQAQRDVIYSLYKLERARRTLAVQVAGEYLGVLQLMDQVSNAEENYRQLLLSSRRARRLSESGRLEAIQVDQSLQDELTARERWISAQQSYAHALDNLKLTLGLPADAAIELDRGELQRLAQSAQEAMATADAKTAEPEAAVSIPPAPAEETGPNEPPEQSPAVEPQEKPALAQGDAAGASTPASAPASEPAEPAEPAAAAGQEDVLAANQPVDLVPPSPKGGPLEMDETQAVRIALDNRLDLRSAIGQVYDAQRKVVVAADALKADVALTGSGSLGSGRSVYSADQPDARLEPQHGLYAAGAQVNLPLERTAERNAYRNSLIYLQQATRSVQSLEDAIKLQVRDDLRQLLQSRESYFIQAQAAKLAQRRVDSTQLFLQAGRAQIRDLLEAQDALINARDAVTAALVSYRVTSLQFQRDLDVLEIDEKGLWREYQPK